MYELAFGSLWKGIWFHSTTQCWSFRNNNNSFCFCWTVVMCLMVYISMVMLYISFQNHSYTTCLYEMRLRKILKILLKSKRCHLGCPMLDSIGFRWIHNNLCQEELQRKRLNIKGISPMWLRQTIITQKPSHNENRIFAQQRLIDLTPH